MAESLSRTERERAKPKQTKRKHIKLEDLAPDIPSSGKGGGQVNCTHALVMLIDTTNNKVALTQEKDGSFWLPGGKREQCDSDPQRKLPSGHNPVDTVLRELEEEAGVTAVHLKGSRCRRQI